MASIESILRAVGELGPKPTLLYGMYQILLRLGWLKWRTPQFDWQDASLAHWLSPGFSSDPEDYLELRVRNNKCFFFHPDDEFIHALRQAIGQNENAAIAEADSILEGRFQLFGTENWNLGFPPDWGMFASPPGDSVSDSIDLDRHWTQYDDTDFSQDIKLLWEPARFGWVFPLVRAYVLTGDVRYADAIWDLVDSWRESNPPNSGPHWSSAQEVAIRMLTIVFALQVTFPRVAETPQKLCQIAETIAVHAARIPPTMLYARAQGNNHLLVEAVGYIVQVCCFRNFVKRKRGAGWGGAGWKNQYTIKSSPMVATFNIR